MNSLDKKYTDLLQDILDNGVKKETRNGSTISVFGRQIRHKMSEGFPLITTKKMYFKGIVTELLWFLRGNTNIKFLVDNDCHIWNGDAWTNYSKKVDDTIKNKFGVGPIIYNKEEFINKIKTDDEFAKEWGDLGPIYGNQWRSWKYIKEGGYLLKNGNEGKGTTTKSIDQIANLIHDLKTNPDSRRLMVNAWNVGELDQMTLPPCFTSDMLVACIDGYRKISEITTNDLVLTEDGSYQKVYELHETNYNGNLLKIKTHANSKSINATPNHPFLVRDKGYINASEITKNDYLGIPINKNEIIPSFKTIIKDNQYSEKEIETVLDDKDYWYLMGYFLGDGWLIDSKKEIYFTINNNQADEVLPRLNKIIGLAKLNNSGLNCKKYVGRKQQLFEILTMFGKYADGKFIPQFVHDAPNYLIEEFLKGYQRADGCITKDGINYTTVSDNIAYGLQLLYAKIKVKASVFYQKRPNKKIIEGREVNQKNTYSINVYQQKNKSKNYIFDNDYLWLRVNGIETCNYDGYVYNISTENNHTYNVFNLVNHNCHYGFQVYTRELSMEERSQYKRGNKETYPVSKWRDDMGISKEEYFNQIGVPTRAISLMWNQRSCDVPLGIPFNIASYGLLLEIIAKAVNMVPNELIGNLGDCHIYSNQIDGVKEQIGREITHEERQEMLKEAMGPTKYQFAIQEQVPFSGGLSEYYNIYKIPYRTREPYQLPTLKHMKTDEFYKSLSEDVSLFTHLDNTDFVIEGYQSHPTIKMPLSN